MQKELLSAYMDGEKVSNEFIQELCQDEELQQSWENFHFIRSVIRQEDEVFLGHDFTQKMENLIAQEETKLSAQIISQPMPEEIQHSPFMTSFKRLLMPVTQVAIAAGVCLLAITGVQTFNLANQNKDTDDLPVLQTLPFNNSVQEVSYNVPPQEVVTPEQIEKKNKRIGAMLQNYELQKRIYSDEIGLQRNGK